MKKSLLIEDVNYIKKILPEKHVDLYSLISKARFNYEIQAVIDEIYSEKFRLEYFEIILKRIFSKIKDSHTTIHTNIQTTPVYFEYLRNGYYPLVINTELKGFLGKKLITVEEFAIDEFIEKIVNFIIFDNNELKRVEVSKALQNYNLIKYVSDRKTNTIKYTFENTESVEMTPSSKDCPTNQTSISSITGNRWLNGKRNYFVERNKDSLYLKYSRCRKDNKYSFEKLLEDIKKILKEKPNKIIVDLRNNPGGNSSLFNPIAEIFESYMKNNSKIDTYCLINSMVFSSGVLNTYEMKQKFNATLVGQPTGQGVNHFGETKTFKLPNSKIKIKYSSKFFQLIDDTANSIKPDIVIEPTIDDYLTGNDPVINYCLAQ